MDKTCEQCGQPMIRFCCEDCEGQGGWWQMRGYLEPAGDYFRWQECDHCAGTGKMSACANFHCPGKTRYAASALDEAILKAVNGGSDK